MKIIIQRVNKAKVEVDSKIVGEIGKGLFVLIGVGRDDVDSEDNSQRLARKVLRARLWDEQILENEKKGEEGEEMEKPKKAPRNWYSNVMQNNYGVLVVSQFTLFGKMKGNKPDFHSAMEPKMAEEKYNRFVEDLKKEYDPEMIQTGAFGKYMNISLENDGPVTFTFDSDEFKGKK